MENARIIIQRYIEMLAKMPMPGSEFAKNILTEVLSELTTNEHEN